MWQGQHESVRHWIYQLLPEVAQHTEAPLLHHQHGLLATLPLWEYDQQALAMAHRFAVSALTNQVHRAQPLHPWGLDVLWALAQVS